MARCAGTTRDGRQCTAIVNGPNGYCYQHDPERAEERRRNSAKAGRSSGSGEIKALKARLNSLTTDVINGDVPQGRAAVAGQLINAMLRALELERRWKEMDEIEERLAALEDRRVG